LILTAGQLSRILKIELERGYDVVKISRKAFQIYQEYGVNLTSEMDEKLLELIAMEEGPEFEYSEEEFRSMLESLEHQ
jgi:hypothetical protein